MPNLHHVRFDLSSIRPSGGSQKPADAQLQEMRRDERLGAAMESIKPAPTFDTTYFDNGLTKAKLIDKVAGLNVKSCF